MTFTTILKGIGLVSVGILCFSAYIKSKKTTKKIDKMVSNDELKSRMDRIIEWVKTCDTKASIMLTLVCLVMSFIFTSDFILTGFSKIIQSLRLYMDTKGSGSIGDISISALFAVVFMTCYIYYSLGSVYRLIMVLYSKIEESQIESGLRKRVYQCANRLFKYKPSSKTTGDAYLNSLIHFNNIANYDSYEAYKSAMESSENHEQEDLLSQIYINANRCKEKFNDYNAAIRWMIYSILFLIPLFVSISSFMTYRG